MSGKFTRHSFIKYSQNCCGVRYREFCNVAAVLPVTLGLQQTLYEIGEVDGYQLVCLEVLCGDIDNREIVLGYSTASGSAGRELHI